MRRTFVKAFALCGLVAISAAPLSSALAQAGDFPTKPIRIIVPATPGGTSDVFARAVALEMQKSMGQPVLVEYKAGAGTNIGNDFVAKAAADGYTLLLNGLPLTVNPTLYPNLSYTPATDYEPIIEVGGMMNVVTVHPSLPVKNLKELVELSKTRKDSLNFGSPGAGSSGHLSGELLAMKTGAKLTHIPYQGNAQATNDHLGGFLEVGFVNVPVALQFVQAGKLRPLAVTGSKRSPMLPDVPTVAEALDLPDYQLSGWFGILAPKGTPEPILKKLHAEMDRAIQTPAVQNTIRQAGGEPAGGSMESFRALLKNDTARLTQVIQTAGIKNTN